MRAVLDPNVVISALISSTGNPAGVLRAWRDGRFEMVASPQLLAELERAFSYPKLRRRILPSEAEAAVGWLREGTTMVDDPTERAPVRSDDPGDDYLIALAASQSAALVSGDRHLIALAARIPVYSPRDFLALLA